MSEGPTSTPRLGWLSAPQMRYESEYLWILFLSALDVILTGIILRYGSGGGGDTVNPELEINPLARMVIASWGMLGASVFKFGLVTLVIVMCEIVGRRKDHTGRALARAGVGISAIPVAWSLILLFTHRLSFFEPIAATGSMPSIILSMLLRAGWVNGA